jgi:hypothetical protein
MISQANFHASFNRETSRKLKKRQYHKSRRRIRKLMKLISRRIWFKFKKYKLKKILDSKTFHKHSIKAALKKAQPII